MEVTIIEAAMSHSKEDGYLGHVSFRVESHAQPYELTLSSKSGKDWSYALNFLNESGTEAQIDAVEAAIEEDDELFDRLVEAAKSRL
ncbi:hypothetical protein [Paenibacillus sp. HJGM_3]|uniref:hypothetical protein n=1 Tax=Paenibacillus sp. HJGM_3 TaxID=3379816 RepID=UPI00385B1F77